MWRSVQWKRRRSLRTEAICSGVQSQAQCGNWWWEGDLNPPCEIPKSFGFTSSIHLAKSPLKAVCQLSTGSSSPKRPVELYYIEASSNNKKTTSFPLWQEFDLREVPSALVVLPPSTVCLRCSVLVLDDLTDFCHPLKFHMCGRLSSRHHCESVLT